ncbi:ABC transporter permease [Streptomyces smaragdinus]|uniref:ABC transporter permease n=1 Tax=Streptomyces smaragdinus TaxID=2585196 RepID=UPI002B202682|nr:ABC transporter permease [Streptomyces smaragdinus]
MPAQGATDVIHDIGYRHYDGPRLGRAYARRSLYVQSLRGAYGLGRSARSKILPMILFGLMNIVALILDAVAIYAGTMTELPIDYTDYAFYMTPVLYLYIGSQAPQSVSRDLRFRTIPLYFSRPINQADYVSAKYAALTTAMFVFTATPLVLLYLGALLAKFDFADNTTGFLQALVSVAILSALFSAVGLLLAALTPRRGFGVAAVIAVLFVSQGAVSVVQGICFHQDKADAIGWVGLGSPTTLVDNIQSAFLGATPITPEGVEPSTAAGVASLAVCALIIAGCCALLLRRYRKAGL